MKNINFIGGIHGVGKGTICHEVCKRTNLLHLVASDLLKWDDISVVGNKRVEDIPNTQNRLIVGLRGATKRNESYLLDGHFCLFNTEGEVEKIPLDTFLKISPNLIAVVTAKVELIKQRLEKRDNQVYDFDVLENMQNIEKAYAEEISSTLNVTFIEVKGGNFQPLIKAIR